MYISPPQASSDLAERQQDPGSQPRLLDPVTNCRFLPHGLQRASFPYYINLRVPRWKRRFRKEKAKPGAIFIASWGLDVLSSELLGYDVLDALLTSLERCWLMNS